MNETALSLLKAKLTQDVKFHGDLNAMSAYLRAVIMLLVDYVTGIKTPLYLNNLGSASVSTVNSATPAKGDFYKMSDAGDLTDGVTDLTIALNDFVIWNGTDYTKAISKTVAQVNALEIASTAPADYDTYYLSDAGTLNSGVAVVAGDVVFYNGYNFELVQPKSTAKPMYFLGSMTVANINKILKPVIGSVVKVSDAGAITISDSLTAAADDVLIFNGTYWIYLNDISNVTGSS